jgi:hypothetical protein
MYGINWKPRYTLNITGDSNVLQGWADISNNTLKEYSIEKTELFGGDVNIRQHRPQPRGGMMFKAMALSCSAAPTVHAEGEVAGLYMYSISDGYTLQPRSTFSLPFAAPTIELKKVALLECSFNQSNSKGQSGRVYKMKSNEFLPNGPVTVREDGRVVGQSNIPDLSADENCDLNVGNDPEVSFEREVQTLCHNENQSEYEVKVIIKNNKRREINIEFIEHLHGRYEVKPQNDGVIVQNDFVKYERKLEAKAESSFIYKVKFYYK